MKKEKKVRMSNRKKDVFKKVLIILATICVASFIVNKAFDVASDKVQNLSQEEKESMDNKWNNFIESLDE